MFALVAPGNYLASLEGGNTKLVATAATRVQLSASSVPVEGVVIQALESNTGRICVGGSDVVESKSSARIGVVLLQGDSISIGVKDLNIVWLDSSVSGEGVSYMPFK